MKFAELVKSWKIKRKFKNQVRCARTAIIDGACSFEGKNFVGKDAVLHHTVLGRGSYVAFETELNFCEVGRYSCIGPKVEIISGKHPLTYLSMHPFFYSTKNQIGHTYVEKDTFEEHDYVSDDRKTFVEIGNDVWIGHGAKIMSGVRIGNGAVVAAEAMVTKDVPPYAIVGGVPAKIIRYRFDEKTIEDLNEIRWWDKDEAVIKECAASFRNVDEGIRKLREHYHAET